jgi:hypothetical protein
MINSQTKRLYLLNGFLVLDFKFFLRKTAGGVNNRGVERKREEAEGKMGGEIVNNEAGMTVDSRYTVQ